MRFLLLALVLSTPVSATAETRVPQTTAEISLSFAPVVKKAAPAVVNIYAKRMVASRRSLFADDPLFGGFFEQFESRRPQLQNSLGSGVIVSEDGLVVSNYHVVGGATDIRVVLKDRREVAAKVVLADEESDLAILQLDEAEGLTAVQLRDSETLEVGELVLAIGNPFGVGQTVSSGIISGLARTGAMLGNARGYFIQTDAAINPGNSGGALVDIEGRLLGINTSILTRSGGSNGIGFAIPSNLVQRFIEQAEEGFDRFQRPWAGVSAQPVSADLAEGLGMSRPEGIVLTDLHPRSPFAERGLAVGDVILDVDGQPVTTPAEMIFRMSVTGIGREVELDVLRMGQERKVSVPLSAPPDDPPREAYAVPDRQVFSGLEISNINPAVAQETGWDMPPVGVVVTRSQGVASRVGLRPGDVLVEINGTRIQSTSDVADMLNRGGRGYTMRVLRGGRLLSMRFRV